MQKGHSKKKLRKVDDEVRILQEKKIDLEQNDEIDILETDSKLLMQFLPDLKKNIHELRDKINGIRKEIDNGELKTENGVSFLEVKNQLLLNYCINLSYFLLRKTEGKEIQEHPVVEELVRTRTTMEKLRPINVKLKYQIDKLVKQATLGVVAENNSKLNFKPNIVDFMPLNAENEEDVTEEINKEGKYVVRKGVPVPYTGDIDHEDRKKEKMITRAKKSHMFKFMNDKWGTAPEEIPFDEFKGFRKNEDKQDEEFEKYEEDNFKRVQRPKESKRNKKFKETQFRDALGVFEKYANVGDVRESTRDDSKVSQIIKKNSFRKKVRPRDGDNRNVKRRKLNH
jgi:U3 small nucleolar ribonucleoprotein protein LCP5